MAWAGFLVECSSSLHRVTGLEGAVLFKWGPCLSLLYELVVSSFRNKIIFFGGKMCHISRSSSCTLSRILLIMGDVFSPIFPVEDSLHRKVLDEMHTFSTPGFSLRA